MQMPPPRSAAQPAALEGWMCNWPLLVSDTPLRVTFTLPWVVRLAHGVVVLRPSTPPAPSNAVPANSGRLSAEAV